MIVKVERSFMRTAIFKFSFAGISLECSYPLGGKRRQELFNDPVLQGIAEKHKISVPQVFGGEGSVCLVVLLYKLTLYAGLHCIWDS